MYAKKKKSPNNMSGKNYDVKEAYNKDLTSKARLHYLENAEHDIHGKSFMSKHSHSSPLHKGVKDADTKYMPIDDDTMGNVTK